MNKILLALILLGTGTGAFHAARNSTIHFQQEARASRDSWQIETQRVATAQNEQVRLKSQVEDLKRILRQRPVVAENPVLSALQTNRTGDLSPELHERLREELGFNWTFSRDYIVVSKETVRALHMGMIKRGKIDDLAAAVLELTPQEHGQVNAALQQIRAGVNEWTRANIEREEPQGDEVAHYTLRRDPTLSLSVGNSLGAALVKAVGGKRAEIIMWTGNNWIGAITGIPPNDAADEHMIRSDYQKPLRLIVERYVDEDGRMAGYSSVGDRAPTRNLSLNSYFPPRFRVLFPNGWADIAAREGFTLPEESQKKPAVP